MYCGVAGGDVKWYSRCGTQLKFLKKKYYINMIQQPCFWGFLPRGSESKNNG